MPTDPTATAAHWWRRLIVWLGLDDLFSLHPPHCPTCSCKEQI